ncbi:MAG TPA: FAD-dependent monooxygenase [Bryobacteraceae bacterium]
MGKMARERTLRIVGGGPAGSAAAIAARDNGASVHIAERHRGPRHKVCGEFIAGESAEILESLGVWQSFRLRGPACIRRCVLRFGSLEKTWRLSDTSYGLSRLALDRLLIERAIESGAEVARGEIDAAECAAGPAILAAGRHAPRAHGERLFGFKAHFAGPTDDAVELYFARPTYVGVSSVEDGLTNVCGLTTESALRCFGFDFDEFVMSMPALAVRLGPLARQMKWIAAGPLAFSKPHGADAEGVYPAGDALGFTDPFTGSGILNALATGRLAGESAARGMPVAVYRRECRRLLGRAFTVSSLFRRLLRYDFMPTLAALVPGDWLYRLTRV